MFTKSYYSLKYGILSPEELIQWAKEASYERAVLVDINTTTAALGFVRSAQEQKIAPIVGVEIRNGIDHCYTILAKNNRGFHEANQFLSVHLHEQKNFPERPPHLGNCIVLYPQGKQPRKLSENEWIGVQSSELNRLKMQKGKIPFEKMLAFEPMVFRHKRDFNTHRLLRAMAKNVLLSKLSEEDQANENEKLIPFEELKERFVEFPQLFENMEKVLRSCSIHFAFGEAATPQNSATYTGSKAEDLELLTA
jgi:DNA polymerase-3 subunit alpha